MKKSILVISILVISIISCKKDKKDGQVQPVDEKATVEMHLENRIGNLGFFLNEDYVTAQGDTVKFTKFNYYLSNFEFIKSDGSVYTIPKDSCYFLVKADDSESQDLVFKDLPAGDYKGVRFIIGIDSLKSASPAEERTGVLDVTGEAADMYWSWNTGYIFVKAEGTSPQSADSLKRFKYHIGLFGGYSSPTINNIKKVELLFDSSNYRFDASAIKNIHCFVNPLELFSTPYPIRMSETPIIMASPSSANIADNYADMIKFDHIH